MILTFESVGEILECAIQVKTTEQNFPVVLLIELFHKWRLINCSFVFMKISPTSLVSMCKIQRNFYSEMSLVGLINM